MTVRADDDPLVVMLESPVFLLDTLISSGSSPTNLVVLLESSVFILDTRISSGSGSLNALVVQAESPVFVLDTRLSINGQGAAVLVVSAESTVFTLDTRLSTSSGNITLVVQAESPPFVLDTRLSSGSSALASLVTQVESASFALDTRLTTTFVPGPPGIAESPVFTLDTRAPVFTAQPQRATKAPGTTASFSASGIGVEPLTYQWQFNGTNLADNARIGGSQSTNLTITDVLVSDAGNYQVLATNPYGSATSAVATLTVVIPETNPPAISQISVAPGLTNCAVTWLTDEPATSVVEYGLAAAYGLTNQFNTFLTTNHVLILSSLIPGTNYHFSVGSADFFGNFASSADAKFTTLDAPDLQVRNLTVEPALPTSGASVIVRWLDTNSGSGPARGFWYDRVTVVNTTANFTVLEATTAFDANADPITNGTSRARSLGLTLPAGQNGAGDLSITVRADAYNAVVEYAAGLDAEANNAASLVVPSSLAPAPDLIVQSVVAPTTAAAGETIEMVYVVTNQGNAVALGPWLDYVSVSTNPAITAGAFLGSFPITNTLPPGISLVFTQRVVVPLEGDAGAVYFIVTVNGGRTLLELSDENNTGASARATTVPLALSLSASAGSVAESGPPLTLTVTRNGSRAAALVIDLNSSDPSELAVPASVSIAAGQSSTTFSAQPQLDGVFDGPQTATISAAVAGYTAASTDITVLDSDVPALSFSVAKPALLEGEGTVVTVTRQVVTSDPLTVLLTAPNALAIPGAVTIAGGQASATFNLISLNNTAFEPTNTYTLRGSAAGFLDATATITVTDDDVPNLTIALSTHIVSEGAGPNAVTGTVTRDRPSTRSLAVALFSSNTNAARVQAAVVIPGGQTNASFIILPVNNSEVDGTRRVVITGFVISTTGNMLLREAAPDMLEVTDDDGPALFVNLSRPLAGERVAVAGTVRRNNGASGALAVHLASSDFAQATVISNVVIPAGVDSMAFVVDTVADGIPGGNRTVTITADAEGYAPGAATLTVSDIDLPDLVVTAVNAPTNAVTGQYLAVNFRVDNQGVTATTTNFIQRLSISTDPVAGGDTLLAQAAFPGPLSPGQFFAQTFQVRMPTAPGLYWLVVETDVNNDVAELLENNNTRVTAVPVVVERSYTASVSADLHTAPANTPIPLRGAATYVTNGAPAAFELVNVHITVRGTRRIFSALTDATGHFAVTFNPLPSEAGVYSVGADHPGASETPAQDQFTLLGLRIAPPGALVLAEGESASGSVWIENLSDVPLTGLSAAVVASSASPALSLTLASNTLPGNDRIALGYSLNAPLGVSGHGTFIVRVSAAEGVSAEVALPVTIEALRPRLVATPPSLVAGMKRGAQTTLQFGVTNAGGQASGPIDVLLPNFSWLAVASGATLPPLAPGQGAGITLLMSPPLDLPLGPYSGNLALNSSNAGLAVSFNFRCLSDAVGALRIQSVDEYTYYAEGAPRVTNATVRLSDAYSGAVVLETNTAPAGELLLPGLVEGYYDLTVNADQHSTFHDVILIEASRTNDVTALMGRQSVQYTWSVTPVEIEDRYTITVETVFETSVPKPVIVVEPSVIDLADMVENERQVNITISNHGLIAAQAAKLTPPTHPDYTFTPLITDIGLLPAQTSLTIPITVRRVSTAGPRVRLADADSQPKPCTEAGVVEWDTPCGTYIFHDKINFWFIGLGACIAKSLGISFSPTPPPPPLLTDFFNRLGNVPWAYAPDGFPNTGGIEISGGTKDFACDPCNIARLRALLKCAIKFIPFPDWFGCVKDEVECLDTSGHNLPWFGNYPCLKFGYTCLEVPGEKFLKYIECFYEYQNACRGLPSSEAELRPAAAMDPPTSADELLLSNRLGRLQQVLNMPSYLLGNENWRQAEDEAAVAGWFGAFIDRIDTNVLGLAGASISPTERAELLALPLPPPVTPADAEELIDRWNRSVDYWNAGILTVADVPPGGNTNFIDLIQLQDLNSAAQRAQKESEAEGFSDPLLAVEAAKSDVIQRLSGGSGGGICAKVRLRLDQTAIISRDAFQATLEVDNYTDGPLEEVFFDVQIAGRDGTDTTALFQIRPPTLTGISAVDGTGIIPGNSSASVAEILVPSSLAAPTNASEHIVTGTLRYRQNGLFVTVPLAATPITVLPNPSLIVRYFHQRDVFSDDPFTPEIEPAQPFSLAVLVQNLGYGTANHLRITSAQPRIIDNEKGLFINFEIIATEVAGQPLQPSLTVDLGDIGPGQTVLGRWLLRSSLQGLFTDYQATFEHIDGKGDKRLSLIDHMEIHEMIHLVRGDRRFDDGRADFLVNDVPDLNDFPDTLWFSSGSNAPVSVVTNAVPDAPASAGHLQVPLTVTWPAGWTYLRVPDPGMGHFRLVAVRRDDGSDLLPENYWLTDRTFIGFGQRPRRENFLHLLDHNANAGVGTYTLVYEPLATVSDTTPPSSQVAALPALSAPEFALAWSGSDNAGGSGLAFFDVFVSADDGFFTNWLAHTSLRGGVFQGTAGSRYRFYTRGTDQAGNVEPIPAGPYTETTIGVSNTPPAITLGKDIAVDAGSIVTITPAVMDADLPTQAFSFDLLPGAPPGVALDPPTGIATWYTGEASGQSTNLIQIRVTDNGQPPLSATGRVTVVVNAVNRPPTMEAIPSFTINEKQALTYTVRASDFDLPAQVLTFSLGAGAPAGATIGAATGVFAWIPSEIQGGTTNRISVIVRDSGTPPLSATQMFSVIVRDTSPDFVLSLGSTNVSAGQSSSVPLLVRSGQDLTNVTLKLTTPSAGLAALSVQPVASEVGSAVLSPEGTNSARLSLTAANGQVFHGELALARLAFDAVPAVHSSIVPLPVSELRGVLLDGAVLPNGRGTGGRVFVIGQDPLLDALLATNGVRSLVLYGHSGEAYEIQSTTNLYAPRVWQPVREMELTGAFETWTGLPAAPSQVYYRGVQLASPSVNRIGGLTRLPDGRLQVQFTGVAGRSYVIEASTNLLNWQTISTNTAPVRFTTPAGSTAPYRFFRLKSGP